MVKQISILFILLLLCENIVWAQRSVVLDDRAARKQWEEDRRADEYANSLRRRDWLKDRLILEMGMGTKFPTMGANWFGFGAGAEYITKWHASAFLTGGFILSHDDPVFPPEKDSNSVGYTLDGGMGWRFGFAYYLFPKNPIHISFQASYGTVFYDHVAEPTGNKVRSILLCYGYELDAALSYLSDQWYFLQAIIGVYSIGNGIKGNGANGDPNNLSKGSWSWGRSNPSWKLNEDPTADPEDRYVSIVEVKDKSKGGIPPVGIVFGLGIGFAFEEFFPYDTELRRREREGNKSKQSQFRKQHSSSFR
jgi:hypothetical protein